MDRQDSTELCDDGCDGVGEAGGESSETEEKIRKRMFSGLLYWLLTCLVFLLLLLCFSIRRAACRNLDLPASTWEAKNEGTTVSWGIGYDRFSLLTSPV